MKNRVYVCIDLKSFFASCECVERGLDPFKVNLVVADPDRSVNTVCLAITPAMKELGIKNRCRIKEIPKNVDSIIAKPRMRLYMRKSAEIYGVYLRYIHSFISHSLHLTCGAKMLPGSSGSTGSRRAENPVQLVVPSVVPW